jgi:hypothetical protein
MAESLASDIAIARLIQKLRGAKQNSAVDAAPAAPSDQNEVPAPKSE